MAVACVPGFACDAPRAVFPIAGLFSSALELHLEICTLFLRALCIFSIFRSRNFALVDFLGPSSTHSCECSRAGGAGVAGSLLPGDSALGLCQLTVVTWTYDGFKAVSEQQQQTTTTTNTIWGGSVLTGEEPPPHSGELKHALPQAGGPTQSQLSRPMSSGHHISMEHRLRRKQLNSDTDASNKK